MDYIVYMGSKTKEYSLSSVHHLNILKQVIQESTPEESLIRSYGRSFNGFAARLTEKESKRLKSMAGVVSVFPSRTLQLQTTRSWDFIGLPEPTFREWEAQSDIIIGVIDTGIWPELPSFSDDGLSPVPKKWKGVCQGQNFTCNNKVVGAKSYVRSESARDTRGHGSHTASIAAGRKVDRVSFFGLANGTARGGAPSARVAVYQVCSKTGCVDSNIVAAFDDAISDGVDLISISIGGDARYYDVDSISIGAFHALDKGILTVQSAGNSGSFSGTVGSVAPWILTVAASSTDRQIIDKVVLGNGTTLTGLSVNTFGSKGKKYPLVYVPLDALNQHDQKTMQLAEVTKGKIVITESAETFEDLLKFGAAGAIARTDLPDVSSIVPFPSLLLKDKEYEAILSYLNSTRSPTATMLKSETVNDTTAPIVVSFSSRGPNPIAWDILKPDITAPGVDILAGYSPVAPISDFVSDTRHVKYSVLSGTSMSCPHVAGAAAYLKSLHPDWSPSAIKSALLTTALPLSKSKNPDGEFAYGAGHLNPFKATNPGLVYETTQDDYITFLCKLNYTKKAIILISGNKSVSCPDNKHGDSSPKDVNSPTLSAKIDAEKPFNIEFTRTVTNVGVANSTYTAEVKSERRLKVTVEPNSLSFKSLKEQKSFKVTVTGEKLKSGFPDSGSLVWSDGIHSVRSPIVVYTV